MQKSNFFSYLLVSYFCFNVFSLHGSLSQIHEIDRLYTIENNLLKTTDFLEITEFVNQLKECGIKNSDFLEMSALLRPELEEFGIDFEEFYSELTEYLSTLDQEPTLAIINGNTNRDIEKSRKRKSSWFMSGLKIVVGVVCVCVPVPSVKGFGGMMIYDGVKNLVEGEGEDINPYSTENYYSEADEKRLKKDPAYKNCVEFHRKKAELMYEKVMENLRNLKQLGYPI